MMNVGRCANAGAVELVPMKGESSWLPTVCKTWGCPACQKSLLAYVKARIIYGLTRTTGSLFITITYVMGGPQDLRDAQCVASDLRSLWRRLKRTSRWSKSSYVKVPELTERGQVHMHVIVMGTEIEIATCRKNGELLVDMRDRRCKRACAQHELMKAWEEVTGDSFVVDASRIRDNGGSAGYVTKYLMKAFRQRVDLAARGFKRRYAFSRGWPKVERMQLAETVGVGWRAVNVVPRRYLKWVQPEIYSHVLGGGDSVGRVGENVCEIVYGKRELGELKRALKKVKNAETAI